MQGSNSDLFYIIIFISTALGLLLIGVIILYLRLVKKYVSLKENETKLRLDLEKEKEEKLKEVSMKSQKILEEAYAKAQEIVSLSQVFNDEQKRKLAEALSKVSNEELREYQTVLTEAGKVSIAMLKNLSTDLSSKFTPEIENIKTLVQEEIEKGTKGTREAITNAYASLDKEINDYKKLIFSQIDKIALDLIREISLKVLGKTLSKKEHEELVIKALNEAKKENILS